MSAGNDDIQRVDALGSLPRIDASPPSPPTLPMRPLRPQAPLPHRPVYRSVHRSVHRSGLAGLLLLLSACGGGGSGSSTSARPVGDTPVIEDHLDQAAIEAGSVTVDELFDAGEALFTASFNTLDGAGRPESTGTGAPRARRVAPENFNRVSAPDANACSGCHNAPLIGGGGDSVANVFVLGQVHPFVNFDGGEGDSFQTHVLDDVANERATIGMSGAGFIEMLAREMTVELQALRDDALAQAATNAMPVTVPLVAKNVAYGSLTANPDGTLDTAAVVGVDADLVIKPFHQKGVVTSLREFSNNAMNHHHGMQTRERFGAGLDPDADGLADELTEGDVTAVTVFQALLAPPGQVLPNDGLALAAVQNGEMLFDSLGCATCHLPELVLDDPVFSEPNPFHPTGNLQLADVSAPVLVDLTTAGPGPRPAREPNGSVRVRAYTDLKRHDMGTGLAEPLVQAGVPGNEFLTKKLWGMANEPPYMHHGRALTIREAILMHGGEAQTARDAYDALSQQGQDDVVEFLKTLQVLPEDATSMTVLAPFSGAIGDERALATHVDQADVDAGSYTPEALFALGAVLFNAHFTSEDGAGRPETTGTGTPRAREEAPRNMNRFSAPDAGSCGACHNVPRSGGGGDNVANVFVLGQAFPHLNFDGGAGDNFETHTLSDVANERNTLGMFGAGYIELLAREMTIELQTIRDDAISQAMSGGSAVTLPLTSKGVAFGTITGLPGGAADTSAVVGVDADLIVKPFHQKGVVISLREFSNNAMNHHHGMQTRERFGTGVDDDNDGFVDELTEGDVTAVTIYQALLPPPGRKLPADARLRASVDEGEALFASTGCITCHVPNLVLDDPVFTEPNPFNPAGNLAVADVPAPFSFDLTSHGVGPRLSRETNGTVLVPAYTDLKRHDMGPGLAESKVQAGVATTEFLTKKLWGMANEPPYMHHGRALTIDEAIRMHGGDAQAVRDAYVALATSEQRSIVDFLKTLQVLPEGSPLEVVE